MSSQSSASSGSIRDSASITDSLYRKPLALSCGVHHYQWGERARDGKPPFIADLLDVPNPGKRPYAEFWIGAHERLPATITCGDTEIPLPELIRKHPEQILGRSLVERGISELPFLLKVLSCAKPLSVQAHPDRELAAQLHQRDPGHYPDANHKPEIAIALTDFTALCQFRKRREILADINRLAPLHAFFSDLNTPEENPNWLRAAYGKIFSESSPELKNTLDELSTELQAAEFARTRQDECFLHLAGHYPGDRGTLSAYFLNRVELTPGQSIFLAPDEPHAYLQGNIIECMASSDNVVRAGLTTKFIDRSTLLSMLSYHEGKPVVDGGRSTENGFVAYQAPVDEFQVDTVLLKEKIRPSWQAHDTCSIILVLEGAVKMETRHGFIADAPRGSTWLWAAALPETTIAPKTDVARLVRAGPNNLQSL